MLRIIVISMLGAPVEAATIARFHSDQGAYLFAGRSVDLVEFPTAHHVNGNRVIVTFRDDVPLDREFVFSAANEALLSQQTYTEVEQYYHGTPRSRPGLSVWETNSSCPESEFEVRELVLGAGDTVIAFAARFVQHCTGGRIFGEVHYNSSFEPEPIPEPVAINVPADFPDIAAALAAARPSDQILVGPGTYGGFTLYSGALMVAGTDGPETTIIDGAVAVIGGGHAQHHIQGFTFTELVEVGGGSPTIEGNHVLAGISIHNGSATIVDNHFERVGLVIENEFSHPFGSETPGDVIVERNRFRSEFDDLWIPGSQDIVLRRNHFDRVQIRVIGRPERLRIENNALANQLDEALYLDLALGAGPAEIVNNTISPVGGRAIRLLGNQSVVRIENNILAPYPGQRAVRCNGFGIPAIRNNLIPEHAVPNEGWLPPAACPGPFHDVHGNQIADTGLVNARGGDSRLFAFSAAIDAASAAFTVPEDYAGIPRPIDGDRDGAATSDIGAFEFDPDDPSPSPTSTATPRDSPPPTVTGLPTQTPTPRRPLGIACAHSSECASGSCAIVCCEEACDAIGFVCNLPASLGQCVFAPATPCPGDCDGNALVSIAELITSVNIALGFSPLTRCPAVDVDGSGDISIAELVSAVRSAISGCAPPTPTRTPRRSPTPPHQDLSVTTVPIVANALIYNPFSGVFYASLRDSDEQFPRYLVAVNAANGAVTPIHVFDSEPGKLALSDDGRYLYVENGVAGVHRFDARSQSFDLSIDIGSDDFGPFQVVDFAVRPGRSNEIVVARSLHITNRGVALFRDGEIAEDVAGLLAYGNYASAEVVAVVFGADPATLYGFDRIGRTLTTFGVGDTGVLFTNRNQDLFAAGSLFGMRFEQGFLFTAGLPSAVIDAQLQQIVATLDYPGVQAVVPNLSRSQLIVLTQLRAISRVHVVSFPTLVETANLVVEGPPPHHLTHWGSDGIAWLTESDMRIGRSSLLE